MSLARTALRLAAVEALNADPVIGAICAGRVFDSRITALNAKDPKPTICVYTEEDQGEGFSANNGGAPFNQICDLVLEIAMWAEAGEEPEAEIGNPVTDRELEAALDMLEHFAVDALTVGETAQSVLVRKVTRRISRKKSSRFPTDEAGVKLAIRLVTLSAELKGEDQGDARIFPTGPYASLPDPLRSVCSAMPAGSSGELTCQILAAAMTAPALNKFEGADLKIQPAALSEAGPPVRAEVSGGNPEIHDNTHAITW